MGTFFLFVFLLILYWAPTLKAMGKMHPQLGAIFWINLLTGWTLIGWVVAIAISASDPKGRTWQPGPRLTALIKRGKKLLDERD